MGRSFLQWRWGAGFSFAQWSPGSQGQPGIDVLAARWYGLAIDLLQSQRAWMKYLVIALIVRSACGQTLGGDFRFVPSPLPRGHDPAVQGLSSEYLFSPAARSFVVNPKLEFKLPWNADQHTFLLGPEYHLFLGSHLSLNLWGQAGVAKRFALMNPLVQPTDATPPRFGLPSGPMSVSRFNGANEFAVSLGGSVDYKVSDHLTYRILQPEYLLMNVKGTPTPDRRVSTSLRFSFGR